MRLLLVWFFALGCIMAHAQKKEGGVVDRRQLALSEALAFIENHPDSLSAVKKLDFYYSDLPYAEALNYFRRLSPHLAGTREYRALSEKVGLGQRTSVGTTIKPFTYQSLDGTVGSLDRIVKNQQLVLLDFWGSWCIPCRQNAPFLKELYGKYKAQGFTILGISIFERDKKDWHRAVAEDGSDLWYQGLDDTAKSIQGQLGVFAVPTYILIDKNGQVLGRYNGRWKGKADLEAQIRQYLQKI